MEKKRKRIFGIIILLLLTSSNFFKQKGNENIRPIQYISLLVIGGLIVFLIYEIVYIFRDKRS